MSNNDESIRRPAKGPRVGLAQIAPALGDGAANMERHHAAVAKAVEDGCELLVFPELALAGYRLKDSVPDVAIARGSEQWKELEKLSEQLALVVGFVEESPDHLFYNSAAYFEAGRCVAVHRKTYLPTYGMFDEQRYFARGRGVAAFDTKVGRVAMLICEDFLHPTAVTIAACDGATLLVVPSASPARGVVDGGDADSNARSWEAYLQVMARSFGVWVAYCNRVGVEDGVSFWGGSEIVTPAGERIAKAPYYEEGYASAVLSDDAVRRRRIVNPLVRDEDLDLTINELSRIRGRAVEKTATAAAAEEKAPRRERGAFAGDDERPARKPRARDGESPPRRFEGGPPRGFDRDDRAGRPGPGFRPKGPYEQRGGFGRPRSDDEGDRPRFDGPPRPRFGGQVRGGFGAGPRDRDDAPRGRFGGPPRDRDDAPRGRFGGPPRDRDEAPRGRFGAPPRGRDDAPRPRQGGFGPPRGRFGAPSGEREDRGGFGGAKPRFGDDAARPRERQRPEPARKPFHKGGKPGGGRGRKDR